jgi:hypothetical protein
VYRLTLANGPWPDYVFPAGVARNSKTTVAIHGWNLNAPSGVRAVEIDTTGLDANQTHVPLPCQDCGRTWTFEVGDDPEILESDPGFSSGSAAASPRRITPPCVVNGRVATPGEQDRFEFDAAQGDRFQFRVKSAIFGSPLDALLRVENSAGMELARNDDGGAGTDAVLDWKAPGDGSYVAVLSDLMRRGGQDYIYRLHVARTQPDVAATVDASAFSIDPGQSIDIKVSIARLHGHTNHLTLHAAGLPEGVDAPPVPVPAKGGSVTLKLSASAEAMPGRVALRILARHAEPSDPPFERQATAILKGKNAEAGDLLVNRADQILLTVTPKKAPVASASTSGKPPDGNQ